MLGVNGLKRLIHVPSRYLCGGGGSGIWMAGLVKEAGVAGREKSPSFDEGMWVVGSG